MAEKKQLMIKSMTGYGKSHGQLTGKGLSLEVKTLNGKYLDIHLKIPTVYKTREQEIRGLLGQKLKRGKVELIISINSQDETSNYALNKGLMKKYYHELTDFAREQGTTVSGDLIPAILRLPDIVQQDEQTLEEEEWQAVSAAIREAIEDCDNFRKEEGRHLEDDLKLHLQNISAHLAEIPELDASRKENIKQKMRNALEKAREIAEPDPNRFEQELLYYLEKLDINEELVRLEKHLSYFSETLEEPESSGKKLGFIAQEIGREINTIGSKANDAPIQKIVVQMKDELEKIKEQIMNVL